MRIQRPTGTQVPGTQQQVRLRRMGFRDWFRGLSTGKRTVLIALLITIFAPIAGVGLLAAVTGLGLFIPVLIVVILGLCWLFGSIGIPIMLICYLAKVTTPNQTPQAQQQAQQTTGGPFPGPRP